jgi:ribosomal protein L37AE/L43A
MLQVRIEVGKMGCQNNPSTVTPRRTASKIYNCLTCKTYYYGMSKAVIAATNDADPSFYSKTLRESSRK